MESTSDIKTPPKRRRFSADTLSNTKKPANTDSDEESTSSKGADSTPTDPSGIGPSNEITFNGAFDDFNVDPNERNKLIDDFKKVVNRFQDGDSDIEGIEEINKTLQDLQPVQDVIFLYVRFARQQAPSNFNSDSLCSLLCVAKQCSVKPYVFLTKVKSIEIRKSPLRFGVSFSFVTRNTKDVDGVLFETKFLGLKYTLKLLQSTISKSESILGQASAGPKVAQLPHPKNRSDQTTKPSSLFTKLWLGISHRWLAYHMVDHLFSLNKASSWSNQEIFVFSIKVFIPCGRSRYDFLNPLVGLCLEFNDHIDISKHQEQLSPIALDPSLFHYFGNACLRDKTTELRTQRIYETFSNLKKTIKRQTSYRSLALESKWLLLKAYAYHLWLKQANNTSIKSSVLKMISLEEKIVASGRTAPSTGQSGPSPKSRKKTPPAPNVDITTRLLSTTQKPPRQDNDGLPLLLESRKKTTKPAAQGPNDDCCPITTNIPNEVLVVETKTPALPTANLPDMINHSDCNWQNFRLLSTQEMNDFLASYLVIRREDRIDIVSRLAAFEIYSANNLHKLPHCRLNGNSNFYPTSEIGQVVLNIGNKIDEFIDVSSMSYHIAREGSTMFKEHGKLIPSIHDIATLCRAVITHGNRDSKRCSSQCRAFIGNGGLDFPNGIPTTIVDGGFRKKLEGDSSLILRRVLKTIGGLVEFLWRTMDSMQQRANDSPMAPDRVRHSAYSKHLCGLLSMADCVSFEHITLVVSTIYPTTTDLAEHLDVMNDSILGYTRTGTLNMCFMMDSEMSDFALGLQLQVIGNFRRVIRQFMDREYGNHQQGITTQVHYQPTDPVLLEMAYNFGLSLREEESAHKIIFQGRSSRTSGGAQSYSNNYSHSKAIFTPIHFKEALFCDKEYASRQNIQQIKVLGHLEGARDLQTQVNSFHDFDKGKLLLDYLQKKYGGDGNLIHMRSATYHQQMTRETSASYDSQSNSTVFDGHVDKNFVDTAWFIPLTDRQFYTFIAVPPSWNIPRDQESDLQYHSWVSSMSSQEERTKLDIFQENFVRLAKVFMKDSNIRVLIFRCTVGTFLSFPANVCYHATVTVNISSSEVGCRFRDLLIVFPMVEG